MNPAIVRTLAVIVIIEGLIISALVIRHVKVVIKHGVSSNVSPQIANPLYGALEYESPDAKFEGYINQYPGWMLFIPPGTSNSILSLCAESNRTDYVQILIRK